jgi:hypothetical protein
MASAVYSGIWLRRWFKNGEEYRMWRLLGWFSGLVCLGSVTGTMAWISQMQTNALFFIGHDDGVSKQFQYTYVAAALRWICAFFVLYSVEFLCLIVSKLLLLGRLAENATQSTQADVASMSRLRRRYPTPENITAFVLSFALGG